MMMKNEIHMVSPWWKTIRYIAVSAVKLTAVTAVGLLAMKWLGDVLEVVSEHISVGTGICFIFVIASYMIYTDTKNAMRETVCHKTGKRRNVRRYAAVPSEHRRVA